MDRAWNNSHGNFWEQRSEPLYVVWTDLRKVCASQLIKGFASVNKASSNLALIWLPPILGMFGLVSFGTNFETKDVQHRFFFLITIQNFYSVELFRNIVLHCFYKSLAYFSFYWIYGHKNVFFWTCLNFLCSRFTRLGWNFYIKVLVFVFCTLSALKRRKSFRLLCWQVFVFFR